MLKSALSISFLTELVAWLSSELPCIVGFANRILSDLSTWTCNIVFIIVAVLVARKNIKFCYQMVDNKFFWNVPPTLFFYSIFSNTFYNYAHMFSWVELYEEVSLPGWSI